MNKISCPWKWLLAAIALAACATTPNGREEAGCEVAAEAVSAEEACAHPSTLVALCAGEQCGLYRCWEVKEHLTPGRVVLARGGAVLLPRPPAGAQRYWGSAQELPQDLRPVFIIPTSSRGCSGNGSTRKASTSTSTSSSWGWKSTGASTVEPMGARGMRHGISSSKRTLVRGWG